MNKESIIVLELFFLVLLPYAVLVYLPVWDSLRFSKPNTFFVIFLFLFFNTLVGLYISTYLVSTRLVWVTYGVTLIILSLLVFLITTKSDFYANLYLFFIIASYAYFVLSITHFIVAKVTPSFYLVEYSTPSLIAHFISLVITYPFVFLFIQKKVKPIIDQLSTSVWKTMCLIPLLFLIITLLYCGTYPFYQVVKLQFISFTIACFIVSFLVYFFTIKMLEETNKSTILKKSIINHNKQLTLQQNYYRFLQSHIEETKKSRHDFRHHLNTLYAFLNRGDYDNLKCYLESYDKTLNLDEMPLLSENRSVNALLHYYLKIAENLKIEVTISGNIKKEISISDSDLYALLGASLEKAIEACLEVKTGTPFIEITFSTTGNLLSIIVKHNLSQSSVSLPIKKIVEENSICN